jgi:hypothetical protein
MNVLQPRIGLTHNARGSTVGCDGENDATNVETRSFGERFVNGGESRTERQEMVLSAPSGRNAVNGGRVIYSRVARLYDLNPLLPKLKRQNSRRKNFSKTFFFARRDIAHVVSKDGSAACGTSRLPLNHPPNCRSDA